MCKHQYSQRQEVFYPMDGLVLFKSMRIIFWLCYLTLIAGNLSEQQAWQKNHSNLLLNKTLTCQYWSIQSISG